MEHIINKFSVFVFDWDGTLFNSMPIKIRNLGVVFFKHFGCSREKVEELYHRYSGIPRRELFNRIAFDALGRELGDTEFDQLSDEFTRSNLSELSRSGQLFDWTDNVLESLKNANKRTFVSSSAPQKELESIINNLKIKSFLDEVMGSKPDFSKGEEHIQYLLSKYDIAKEEIIFIGDELNDVRLAKAAGVQVGVITSSKSREAFLPLEPDFIFDDLSVLGGRNG
ncbi:MAG: HAD family hydrolase [Candidatus Margulisbacteria bacterium]|nr:HAD family hydrolase [Candidatus Margulisiibacteriota bacterium]